MATQFDPIAKDESLNTTESPSRNVADVLAQGLDAIEQAIAGGSGSGGHVIVNASGTDMTQREKMQFVDAVVTDDAVNDVTKISTTPASYPSANVTYGSGSVEDALDNRDTFTTIDYVIGASSGSNVDSQTTDLTQFKKLALGYTYGGNSYVGYTEIPIDLFKRGVTLTVYNPLNTAFYIQAVWSDNTKVKMSYNVAANYRAVILGIK